MGELPVVFFCSSKEIIDCTLKRAMIYTNVCIIYSGGVELYAYVKINCILKIYKFPIS